MSSIIVSYIYYNFNSLCYQYLLWKKNVILLFCWRPTIPASLFGLHLYVNYYRLYFIFHVGSKNNWKLWLCNCNSSNGILDECYWCFKLTPISYKPKNCQFVRPFPCGKALKCYLTSQLLNLASRSFNYNLLLTKQLYMFLYNDERVLTVVTAVTWRTKPIWVFLNVRPVKFVSMEP